jgi:diguanylate cyclase (GGDEF)-like protein/PAS domain S-box-containing protein
VGEDGHRRATDRSRWDRSGRWDAVLQEGSAIDSRADRNEASGPAPSPRAPVPRLTALAVALACLAGAAATALAAASSGLDGPSLALLAPVAVAGLLVAAGVARHRPATARSWLFLATGRLAFFVGAVAPAGDRGRSQLVAATAVGFALTARGLVLLARRLTRVWDRTRWIDSTVVSWSMALVATSVLVLPNLSASAGLLERVALPAIPAVDLFLVLLATRSLLAVQGRPRSLRLLAWGLMVQLLVDVASHWLAPAGLDLPWWAGSAGWSVASLLVAAAALHPSVSRTPVQIIPWRKLGAVRFSVLVSALVAPLAALAGLALSGDGTPGVQAALAGGTTLIAVLVLVRVSGLVSYADQLADERHRSRFEAMAHHANDAVVILDVDGRISWASPAVHSVLGPSPEAIVGRGLDALLGRHAAAQEELLASLARLPTGTTVEVTGTAESGSGATGDGDASDDDGGRPRTIEGTATNLLEDPAVEGIVLVVRDVTRRAEMEQQLVTQAFVDPLTGLANRALFTDRVSHALSRLRNTADLRLAVLFVDLDDFKEVNDSLGHGLGDELLTTVGRRISEALRPSDTAARLGGDEFAVLLEEVDDQGAVMVGERILQLLAVPVMVGDYPLTISASIGIAWADAEAHSPSVLLRNADLAMYEAKRDGKGQVRAFRAEMHERELRQFTFRSELQEALDRGELALVYQPIVDLATEQVVGSEALLRWNHPERGLIGPVEFIPVAEATRLIVPIGRWILRTACDQLAAWSAELGPMSMDVNVSAVQLLEPDFVDDVRTILAESGVDPGSVVLELTESILVHDADGARQVLDALHGLGVRLAIDDFGTGYSSLAYLQNFPIDIVKIDRAFVDQLGDDGRGRSLARSIIAIAQSLGIGTIAEGIETPSQAADLTALSCQHGQGYHYSRPVSPEAFAALVTERRPDAVAERA